MRHNYESNTFNAHTMAVNPTPTPPMSSPLLHRKVAGSSWVRVGGHALPYAARVARVGMLLRAGRAPSFCRAPPIEFGFSRTLDWRLLHPLDPRLREATGLAWLHHGIAPCEPLFYDTASCVVCEQS
jgi:hypothetical protein